jgi:hypothetical protein
MVKRISLLLIAGLAALALACSGDDNSAPGDSPAGQDTSQPRPTTATTRPTSGPSAIVEPKSGPPGSEITVTGAGWPSGVLVDLTGTVPTGVKAPPYATVVTDGSGGFVAHFRLEKTADGSDLAVGRYDLIARAASVQVDIPFLVETRRPIRNPGPGG